MTAVRSLAAILTYVIVLCGIIPLVPWLPMFPRMMLLIGILGGVWQDLRGRWPVRPWMQNSAIVPVFAYYVLQFSRANPVLPVVSILAIMLAVRCSGEKTVRHSLQIYALATFCLASSSLFDLSPVFLIYLALLLGAVAVGLVLLTFQDMDSSMNVSRPDLKRILISGLLMPVVALPLLLLFFPLIPRTQIPLWNFLNQGSTRSSGYADSVEPGSQSSIAESRTRVFRAEMPQTSQSQLYWRGTVFNRTDGVKWTRGIQIPSEQPVMMGENVIQTIYPEPSAVRTLIALDRPVSLELQRVKRSPDGVFEIIGNVGRRVSYRADSRSGGIVIQRNALNRRFYLQLPDQLPTRIQNLAARIARSGVDVRTRVAFLEKYFRNGGYRYTTKDLATGDKALELFLFEKKQGHCEFFASSFALLLRAAGVPCRVVGGYLGGEYNQLGGYYLVSDDKAHVWVEAYFEGSGWERIDPSSFADNAVDVWKAPGSPGLIRRFSQAVDSLNHLWNRSVITYDFERQITFASAIASHLQGGGPIELLRRFIPYVIGILACAALLFIFGRSHFFCSREERLLKRFLRITEDVTGTTIEQGRAGLFEIAVAAKNQHISDFVVMYADAVYHDRTLTDDEYRQLRRILTELKNGSAKKS